MSKVICYASSLGNCGDTQSAEHYVSKGLWKNRLVNFEGLPWLNGETKTLSVNKVFRKVLCDKHNRALSPLDVEGIRFFRAAEKIHINQDMRKELKRSAIWKVDRSEIDGRKLERLLAKTSIGALQEFPNEKWHLSNTPSIQPPKDILECVYGLRDFEFPMGLYCINSVGDKLFNKDDVVIDLHYHPQTSGYIGCNIAFRNWQFFINLSDINFENFALQSSTGILFGRNNEQPIYRVTKLNFNVGAKLSGVISFKW